SLLAAVPLMLFLKVLSPLPFMVLANLVGAAAALGLALAAPVYVATLVPLLVGRWILHFRFRFQIQPPREGPRGLVDRLELSVEARALERAFSLVGRMSLWIFAIGTTVGPLLAFLAPTHHLAGLGTSLFWLGVTFIICRLM